MSKTRNRAPTATRRKLLEAAIELACGQGLAGLSLDAVAARAGVSKGGLLYHFPTKDDLLRGMIATHVEMLRQQIDEQAPGAMAGEGCALTGARAFVSVMRALCMDPDTSGPGMLATMLDDPSFMEPVLQFRDAARAMFERCPDPRRGILAFLACEGLVHLQLTDHRPGGAPDGQAMLDAVMTLLDEMTPPSATRAA